MARRKQHFTQDKAVDLVIFHHQNVQRFVCAFGLGRAGGFLKVGRFCRRPAVRRRCPLRGAAIGQFNPKRGAQFGLADHTNFAAHRLHNTPRNPQPQPRAIGPAAKTAVQGYKIVKHAGLICQGNAYARIAHAQ